MEGSQTEASAVRGRRTGFVLVAVLVVVMLASMVAVSLMFRLKAEQRSTAAGSGQEQAWAAAMSGVYAAMRVAATAPPGSLDWQDQPEQLHQLVVQDDGVEQWYFSVVAPAPDSEDLRPRFGLSDEAGKLNLLEATQSMLEKIPAMTPPRVQALLDFLDPDLLPSPEGAEQEYYDLLTIPYHVRNGPLESLDELLLVRGFTPDLFYGEDLNGNQRLDPNEDDGLLSFPPDNQDGRLDAGLLSWLTVRSYDPNKTDEGFGRIHINDPKESFNETDFPAPLVKYIKALRTNKKTLKHAAELLEARQSFQDEKGAAVTLESGVSLEDLPRVLDQFTASEKDRFPGLININTASLEVLLAVPEIDVALAESIVAARRGLDSVRRKSIAWLLQENLVDAPRFIRLAPYLTARSYQFRCRVVGYGWPSGRYRVVEALIDVAGPQPSVSYLRDLTRLGLPLDIRLPDQGTDG